ncbi:MAG TPA: DNA-binding response regulator [Alphaproteobacteria bacterium]|nr:DNA-binding response regulator [Alphaproteobacteria bacterium]
MKEAQILLIEDEEPISILVKYNLEKAGFRVHQAFDAEEAYKKIEKQKPDIIILDWMLPQISGIEIAKDLRKSDEYKDIPIIMLTARSQEDDKLRGFDIGIDDYITKPFSPKELVARVKSVLKRTKPNLMEENIKYANIEIDNSKKCALLDGKKLELTPTEFALISFMVQYPERTHSRETLLRKAWHHPDEIEGRAVDVTIRRIRAALENIHPGMQEVIKTVRGEGYILDKL